MNVVADTGAARKARERRQEDLQRWNERDSSWVLRVIGSAGSRCCAQLRFGQGGPGCYGARQRVSLAGRSGWEGRGSSFPMARATGRTYFSNTIVRRNRRVPAQGKGKRPLAFAKGLFEDSRRRPTLPHSFPCSTIGAGGLTALFGMGRCFPSAVATGISLDASPRGRSAPRSHN